MPLCSIFGCASGYADSQSIGVKTFIFPKINRQTEKLQKLSKQRRNAWLTALLGRTESEPKSWETVQICDSHFISGKMAALEDVNNMDWVPTQNLSVLGDSNPRIFQCSVADCAVSNQEGPCRFFRISKEIARERLKQISDTKLSGWITALGLQNEVPATCNNIYVCHDHYIDYMSLKLPDTSVEEKMIDLNTGPTDSAGTFVSDSKPVDNVLATAILLKNKNRTSKLRRMISNRIETMPVKEKPFFKSGDILRNINGQFCFACCYCSAVKNNCPDLMNHINTHFNENVQPKMSVSPEYLPPPEFVNCTVTHDDTMEPALSETFRELTNTKLEPQPSEKGTTFTTILAKSEQASPLKRRLSPQIAVEDLAASRPFNIKRVKTMDAIDATPTIQSATSPAKFIPIRIPPLPAEFFQQSKQPKASDSPGSVRLKSSKALDKTAGKTYNPDTQKSNQCKLEPIVGDSDPDHVHMCLHQTSRCYQCEMEPAINNETDPRRHKCVICEDWVPNHVEFKVHLKDVHDEHVTDNDFNCFANDYKEFNCYICEKTLKQREYLVHHMRGHFEKYLEYQCHLCGHVLRSEGVLKAHMKRHDNTPTECDLCNRIFPNILRMRSHRMCHTSELNHICPVCSKGFKLSKYLRRHMAVHNESKVACRYCDATFKFSTGRRSHEKSVHNVL